MILARLPRGDDLSPVRRNPLQIDAVRIRRLYFHNNDVTVWEGPQPIKADLGGRAAVPAVFHRVAKPSPNLVDNILEGEPAAGKRLPKALVRVAREVLGRHKPEELAELRCCLATICELTSTGESDDLVNVLAF